MHFVFEIQYDPQLFSKLACFKKIVTEILRKATFVLHSYKCF